MNYHSLEFQESLDRARKIIGISNSALPIGIANALIAAVERIERLENDLKLTYQENMRLNNKLYKAATGENTSAQAYEVIHNIVVQAYKETTISSQMANLLGELKKVTEGNS